MVVRGLALCAILLFVVSESAEPAYGGGRARRGQVWPWGGDGGAREEIRPGQGYGDPKAKETDRGGEEERAAGSSDGGETEAGERAAQHGQGDRQDCDLLQAWAARAPVGQRVCEDPSLSVQGHSRDRENQEGLPEEVR